MKELASGQITEEVLENKPVTWELWRSNNISVKGRQFIGRLGAADITGYQTTTGTRIEIEVKKIGDKVSDDQVKFLTHVAACNGIAQIATSDRNGLVVRIEVYSDDSKADIMNRLRAQWKK